MQEPTASAEPAWISAAWRNAIDEVHLYVATFVGFTLSPGRFAAEWAEGQRRAANPLAFVATSASVLGILTQLLFKAMGTDPSLLAQLAWALAPYVYYALLGAAAHLLMRPRRRRLSTSLGIALFAGGASASLAMVGVVLPLLAWWAAGHALPHQNALAALPPTYHRCATVLAVAGFSLFLAELAIGLRRAHGTGRRAALFALVGATLLVAVLMSFVDLPTLRLIFVWEGRFPHPALRF